MVRIKSFALAALATLFVTACAGKPPTDNANAAPTKAALVALETSAYEA